MKNKTIPETWWYFPTATEIQVPDIVNRAGDRERFLYTQFLSRHGNKNTQATYELALKRFYRYRNRTEVLGINSVDTEFMKSYFASDHEASITNLSLNTIKQHFIILRLYFDFLHSNQLMDFNPLGNIRLPSLKRSRGTTPVMSPDDVQKLILSIPLSSHRDYRDRALIGLMLYGLYRVSAALSIRACDYRCEDGAAWIVALEKGARLHEMPVHPVLKTYLDDYIIVCKIPPFSEQPLFQSTNPRSGRLLGRPIRRNSAWEMVKRRAAAARLSSDICNHSFRATGITTYLSNHGDLENARILAGHARLDTTRLYDRNEERRKRSEVLKIDYSVQ
jgi:site-specific recombinase XerD